MASSGSESVETYSGFKVEKFSSNFIAAIRDQLRLGYSVSPFVGSGLSAASGILMGKQFDHFLAHTYIKIIFEYWSIRDQGWPNYPTAQEFNEDLERIKREFTAACEKGGRKPNYDNFDRVTGFETEDTNIANPVFDFSRPLIPKVIPKTVEAIRADRQLLKTAAQLNNREINLTPVTLPHLSPTSEEFVRQCGIRHLFEWRATLEFFAKVRVKRELRNQNGHSTTDSSRLYLGEFDSSIIDSFNTHITLGRKPNLGHKMLAHLTRPMRSRVLLSTNFDDLIEQAFESLNFPLQVLDVRTKGNLPDPKTVRARNTLLKLHGGLIDTRADFSLDEMPDAADMKQLREIFFGTKERRIIPSQLLVVGYSASDNRCVLFIKKLLDSEPQFRVFWVCFHESDIDFLKSVFTESEYRDRIMVLQHNRPELLLYELYQNLTLGLPSGGFAYEFAAKVPPQPLYRKSSPTDEWFQTNRQMGELLANSLIGPGTTSEKKDLADSHDRWKPLKHDFTTKPVVAMESLHSGNHCCLFRHTEKVSIEAGINCKTNRIFVLDIATDAAEISRLAMERLIDEHRKIGVWLEMQDYPTVSYLADDLFRTLALRKGVHQIEHFNYTLANDDEFNKKHLQKYIAHFRNLLSTMGYGRLTEDNGYETDCVVILYGRNIPGAQGGWIGRPWEHDDYCRLEVLLRALNNAGITVLYLPFTEFRHKKEESKESFVDGFSAELFERLKHLKDNRTHQPIIDAAGNDKTRKDIEQSMSQLLNTSVFLPYSGRLGNRAESIDNKNLPLRFDGNREHTRSTTRIDDRLINMFSEMFVTCPALYTLPSNGIIEPEQFSTSLTLEGPLQKLQFLYSLSLHRRSRHVSAFLSEAAFRCPRRFNHTYRISDDSVREKLDRKSMLPTDVLGIDNDLLRSTVVDDWSRILHDNEILLYKSGGYCWKYRDVRIAIQMSIERLRAIEWKFPHRSELVHVGQWRARTHFRTAQWYQQAFFATGHAAPVIEALHHFLMAASFSTIARSTKVRSPIENETGDESSKKRDRKTKKEVEERVKVYRQGILITSVFEAIKLLVLSSGWIPRWLQIHDEDNLFGDVYGHDTSRIAKQLSMVLGDLGEKLGLNKTDQRLIMAMIDRVSTSMQETRIRLQSNNSSEVNSAGTVFHSNLLVATWELSDTDQVASVGRNGCWVELFANRFNLASKGFSRGFSNTAPTLIRESLFDVLCIHEKCLLNDQNIAFSQQEKAKLTSIFPGQKWWNKRRPWKVDSSLSENMRILLDNGILFQAIHDYCVHRVRDCVPLDSVVEDGEAYEFVFNDTDVSLELATVLSETAYAFLKRAKMEALASPTRFTEEMVGEVNSGNRQTSDGVLGRHEFYGDSLFLGRMAQICAICRAALTAVEYVDPECLVEDVFLRIKVKVIYGVALGYLGRFYESQRRFNEATALLSKSGAATSGLNLAIIRLRRGECYLALSERILREIRKELEKVPKDGRDKHVQTKIQNLIRLFYNTFDDAIVNFDYAHDLLAGVAYSNLWWGNHRSLLLRAYSVLPRETEIETWKARGFEVFDSVLFRRARHNQDLGRLFRRLLIIHSHEKNNVYQLVRALDYFVRAIIAREGDKRDEESQCSKDLYVELVKTGLVQVGFYIQSPIVGPNKEAVTGPEGEVLTNQFFPEDWQEFADKVASFDRDNGISKLESQLRFTERGDSDNTTEFRDLTLLKSYLANVVMEVCRVVRSMEQ